MPYTSTSAIGLNLFIEKWNKKYKKIVSKNVGNYDYVIVPIKTKKTLQNKVKKLGMVPHKNNGMDRIWIPPKGKGTKKGYGYEVIYKPDKFGVGFMLTGGGFYKKPKVIKVKGSIEYVKVKLS
jgi:hypothetical protein